MTKEPIFNRRTILGAWAGMGMGLGVGLTPRAITAATPPTRALRIAHLTDVHVQPELNAGRGLAACLRHLSDQKDQPAFILFGGDCVMDVYATNRDRSNVQWNLWRDTLKANSTLPYHATIGNHDIWGWNKEQSGTTGEEADYGKKMAIDRLAMPSRYHAFSQEGWKFISLDSIQPGSKLGSYAAFLDEEQFAWLEAELARTPATMPVLIWSHVPILCGGILVQKRQTPVSDTTVPAGETHTDAGRLVRLFEKHPNVKACLSGHTHLVEDLKVKGVHYLNNGAVSGRWWKGPIEGFREGYALLDLFTDGSLTCQYVPYGWQVEEAK
jgi:3',5'-cyclic-AMP phosphodiesterase